MEKKIILCSVGILLMLSGCCRSTEEEMDRCREAMDRINQMEAVKLESSTEMTRNGEAGSGSLERWMIDSDHWLSISVLEGQETWFLQKDGQQYTKILGESVPEEYQQWHVVENATALEDKVALEYEDMIAFVKSEEVDGKTQITCEVPKSDLEESWENAPDIQEKPEEVRNSLSRPVSVEYTFCLDDDGNLTELIGRDEMEERQNGEKTATLIRTSRVTYLEVDPKEVQQKIDGAYAEVQVQNGGTEK